MSNLALFDLDNTLLSGDSEVLWGGFLVSRGRLGDDFAHRNAEMHRRYQAGEAAPSDFCAFFARTLAGRTAEEWHALRTAFMEATAAALGFEHLISTELQRLPDGRFAGTTQGVLNMREGKVTRLNAWLADAGSTPARCCRRRISTATRSTTCRCCKPSAGPSRSTPTPDSNARRWRGTGRCCGWRAP